MIQINRVSKFVIAMAFTTYLCTSQAASPVAPYTVLDCTYSGESPSRVLVRKLIGMGSSSYEIKAEFPDGSPKVATETMIAFDSSHDGDSHFLQFISSSGGRLEFIQLGYTLDPKSPKPIKYISGIAAGGQLHPRAEGLIRYSHVSCVSETNFEIPEFR